jgi:hypothetical protein
MFSRAYLQDRKLRPYLRAHLPKNPGAERPVHVPQEAQLVVQDRRFPPAEHEEAAHLRAGGFAARSGFGQRALPTTTPSPTRSLRSASLM